jgi:branched-chain amino acid aminotransferase
MQKTKKIWFNGKFLDWEKARVHLLTHSLHYGSSVFEGIRCYQTEKGAAVFRLPEHIERFFFSARSILMKIPFSKKEIKEAILKTIKINKLKECYIRPIAWFGERMGLNTKGIPVQVAIAVWPWKAYLGKKPIKIKSSKFIRVHPRSTICEAKISGNYLNSILASQEAKKAGFDEALLLDFEGKVAEGPGENIFIIKDKKLFTPQKGSILPGITRDSVIKIAKDLKIKVFEKKITLKELKSAKELFFCGTAVEICPIKQVDDVLINEGKIGEITKEIREIYQKIVRGKEKKYLKWLTFVN